MKNREYNRRNFIKTTVVTSAALLFSNSALNAMLPIQEDFPLVDYHVHLSNELTIEKAIELAQKRNIKLGIVQHPGEYFGMKTDKQLAAYINNLRKYPVYVGLQPIYPGWAKNFSNALIEQLDYVLMDGIIIPSENGGWDYTWQVDYYVENTESFMDRYMKHVTNILRNEPINIFAWPTFLPMAISKDYHKLWTNKRMDTIIQLAKNRNIAIEINEIAHVPDSRFITKAKKEGLKFTFGTDARNDNAGRFNYCLQIVKECGLKSSDMLSL